MESFDVLLGVCHRGILLAMMLPMLAFCLAGTILLVRIAYGFCFGR